MMKTLIETAINIYPAFTNDEEQIMRDVDDLLGRFVESVEHLNEDFTMVSLATGEIVMIDEIRRVRGILDALYHTPCWAKMED